ncbi:MAG: LapA family protein [Candidatus Woesearchaeota archaeon]
MELIRIDKNDYLLYFFIFFVVILFLITPSIVKSDVTGETINGIDNYKEVDLSTLEEGIAVINPEMGNIVMGKEFTVEVLAYPFLETAVNQKGVVFNNFYIEIYYDPNYITYQDTNVMIDGFRYTLDEITGIIRIDSIGINPFDNSFGSEPLKFLEIKFLGRRSIDNTEVNINKFKIVNSYNMGKGAEVIKELRSAKFTVLETGMDTFIEEQHSSGSASSKYWPKLTSSEQQQIMSAWNTLSPEEKKKYATKCVPSCSGKECGTDGCGGYCGTKDGKCKKDNEQCLANKCVCQPQCFGLVCGDDGCGGLCYNKECSKEEEKKQAALVKPSSTFQWQPLYTYALIAFALVVLIASMLIGFRKKIKSGLEARKIRKQQAKLMAMSQSQIQQQKQPRQTQQQTAYQPAQQNIMQQSQQPISQQKTQATTLVVSPQLLNYVKSQVAKGIDRNHIEDALVRVGWKKELVDEALRQSGL